MIEVATATDSRYLPWCATLLRSIGRLHEDHVRVHVLHAGDLREPDRQRLAQSLGSCPLVFHDVAAARVSGLPTIDRFGSVVWLRFLLPELLPATRRVLYLDADTLVVGPLDDLWSSDLGGLPLGAVANVVEPGLHDHIADLGIDDPTRYFNSGVLLLDLERWSAENTSAQLIAVASERGPSLLWPDQDALNLVFADRWAPLHPRWNAQNSLWLWRSWAIDVFGEEVVDDATGNPHILHFEGPTMSKPWHYLSPHPWRETYRQLLRATPWAGTGLDDRTVATRLIRLLPRRHHLGAYKALMTWRKRVAG
jgi:lipopolysaccharide biosynthesis glycosyltransferase